MMRILYRERRQRHRLSIESPQLRPVSLLPAAEILLRSLALPRFLRLPPLPERLIAPVLEPSLGSPLLFPLKQAVLLRRALLRQPLGAHREPLLAPLFLQLLEAARRRASARRISFAPGSCDVSEHIEDRGRELTLLSLDLPELSGALQAPLSGLDPLALQVLADLGLDPPSLERRDRRPQVRGRFPLEALRLEAPVIDPRLDTVVQEL